MFNWILRRLSSSSVFRSLVGYSLRYWCSTLFLKCRERERETERESFDFHCVKSARTRSYSGLHFSAFGPEKLRIWTTFAQCLRWFVISYLINTFLSLWYDLHGKRIGDDNYFHQLLLICTAKLGPRSSEGTHSNNVNYCFLLSIVYLKVAWSLEWMLGF